MAEAITYTRDLHEELLESAYYLTQEQINNQFIQSPKWKLFFQERFPNYKAESYLRDAWSILIANGYTYEILRYSNRTNSNVYTAIKECYLLKDGKELEDGYSCCDINQAGVLNHLLCFAVVDEDVNIGDLK